MDPDCPRTDAIGISGSRIAEIGSVRDLLNYKTPGTILYDMSGLTVLPGFNDSHTHLLNYGYSLRMIDLNSCRSINELIARTSEYIKNEPLNEGQWVEGRGWDETLFENGRLPNRKDLDIISTQHPIILIRN